MPSTAHFEATYGAWATAPMRPTTDDTLTMAPRPRARMPGSTAAAHRTAPTALTLNDSWNCAGDDSSTAPLPPMPALLTRTSTPPNVPMRRPNPADTDRSSATSSSSTATVAPRAAASASSLPALSALRTVATTVNPSSARCTAVARPMPEFAPVTTATGAGSPPGRTGPGSAMVTAASLWPATARESARG